jgi:hypothetical protein
LSVGPFFKRGRKIKNTLEFGESFRKGRICHER